MVNEEIEVCISYVERSEWGHVHCLGGTREKTPGEVGWPGYPGPPLLTQGPWVLPAVEWGFETACDVVRFVLQLCEGCF